MGEQADRPQDNPSASDGVEDAPWTAPSDGGVLDVEPDSYFGDDAATLGDRIAAARLAAGLTQSGLAARLGVGEKMISSWENDRSEPRANRLAMLAGLLNVSVSWLLIGGGEGVAPPDAAVAAGQPEPLSPLTIETPVRDLAMARRFYGDVLGCPIIESRDDATSFSFFGHRAVTRLDEAAPDGADEAAARRIGVRIPWSEWEALTERLRAEAVSFVAEPAIHNVGAAEEHGAFVVADPAGNAFEFRADKHAAPGNAV